MAMVCPKCSETFPQQLQCPTCGVRLLYQLWPNKSKENREPKSPPPWGRLIIGLVLAVGVQHVLRNLVAALLLIANEQALPELAKGLTAILGIHGLEAISVVCAGILVGAGQQRGFFLGAVTGVWSNLSYVVIRMLAEESLPVFNQFAESVMLLTCGMLGGLIGTMIWQPTTALAVYLPVPSVQKNKAKPKVSPFAGPVAWIRVLTGVPLAVTGVLCANYLREMIIQASGGKLSIDSTWQANVVAWEISAMAILAGSAFAGATTKNGLKQGLCVGILTATLLTGIRLPSMQFSVVILFYTVVGSLCLSLTGGWFGSQLLPPIFAPVRRRGILRSA